MTFPETKRGRPRKHPVLSHGPTSVGDIAEHTSFPWETVVLAEGSKGPVLAERKILRCFSSRADRNRNYVKPGGEIWLYRRKYADGEIKYFICNSPTDLPVPELDRAATLRWPIEQCFEMPAVIKLMHGIIAYIVTDMRKIVCYHIRRNHCAYLSHRNKKLYCSL